MTGVVYDDALADGWQNWSWDTAVDATDSRFVEEGSASLRAEYEAGWAGLYLAKPDLEEVDSGDSLQFSIHGGTEARTIKLHVVDGSGEWIDAGTFEPATNEWTEVSIPLAALGSPNQISGLVWQEFTGSEQTPFYLDNIVIDASGHTDPGGTDDSSDFAIEHVVYDDSLQAPWGNWSWSTDVNATNGVPVNSGANSIAATHNEAWSGLYMGTNTPIDASSFDELHFSINGGTGGQTIGVFIVDTDGTFIPGATLNPESFVWTQVAIDLDEVGGPNSIAGIVWQEQSGEGNQGTFFIDDVLFVSRGDGGNSDPPVETGITITIDAETITRQINDDIYGLNFADESLAAELDLPLDRWGGNSTTRYNYQLDASNRASDWFFENHPENDSIDVDLLPDSSTLNQFIEKDRRVGADTIVTVGTIGWAAKSREIIGAFSVEEFGPQQVVDPWRGYGNGIRPDGSIITGNDPTDTSVAVDESHTREWVTHLVSQFGTADEGGVQFYALDNEPMLWNSTHRDVHPEPASYDEVLARGISHATAIKQADPSADVLGPVAWGWTGYFYSALDAAGEGAWWNNPQDRNAHGGEAFIPWYLSEMADAEAETGQRLLDYLDIHYYPQSDGVALTRSGGGVATQQERLNSTRSLWDPDYVDNSWIADEVQLIPRMQEWIDENYPGTKLAITEYNFGGVDHISGAVAQADVLGIFGREGVDLATMWAPPEPDEAAAYAFRMYRNYDGEADAGSRFGESGLQATSTDSNEVSAFASRRTADGAITVMLVNKTDVTQLTPVSLGIDLDASAEIYTYDDSNLSQIVRGEDVEIVDGSATVRLPAYSITLLEIPSDNIPSVEPVSIVDVTRTGSWNRLPVVSATFDGEPTDLSIEVNSNARSIDTSAIRHVWDATNLVATWDLSGLAVEPDRYVIEINAERVAPVRQELLVTYQGDTNLDGEVGIDDFLALARNFGVPNRSWEHGDFDGDGSVDVEDFLDLIRDFGKRVDEVFAAD